MENRNTIRVCVGVLINENHQVLVTSRPIGKIMAGYWEFPGGKIENNETDFQATKRELFEELGVEIFDGEHITTITQDYPHGLIELTVSLVKQWQGKPIAKESQELAWQSINQKLDLEPLLPTTQVIFDKVREFIL